MKQGYSGTQKHGLYVLLKGIKALYVDAFDTEEKIKLTLPSRKQRVEVSITSLLSTA